MLSYSNSHNKRELEYDKGKPRKERTLMKTTTELIESHILSEEDFENFSLQYETDMVEMSLSEYLIQLLEKYHITRKEIIERTYIDLIYGYQIFNGTKQKPSRDYLLQLALAFPLTVTETNHLLYYGASNALYPRVKRDAYIMFALHNHYSIHDVNQFLSDNNLQKFKE